MSKRFDHRRVAVILRGGFVRLVAICLATIAIASAAACGGGGDDESGKTPGGTRSPQATAATRPAETPAAVGSPGRGTPGPRTPAAGAPTTGGATPAPGETTRAGGAPSSFEATLIAEGGGDIVGGDPSAPREPVSTIPAAPSGVTPEIDPEDVAPPEGTGGGLQMIVDIDASQPGVQAARTVAIGDVFRVAIVATDIPTGGLSAFNFYLDYDKTKIVAPSFAGGSSTDRNPDLYNEALGGGWACLPAPEGDVDDAGGSDGDGDPATGRALISCFSTTDAPSGSLVLAVVEFYAVARGGSSLSLNAVALAGGPAITTYGRCESDADTGPPIPCVAGSVDVQ